MYRFVRCQTHPKCPDLQGWYLILDPDDVDTLMKLHKGVTGLYFNKFGLDPHITEGDFAVFYNPIRLAATWLQSVESFLFRGVTLAINSHGGMLPLDDLPVLARKEDKLLIWPGYYDDEVITISRWPEGSHWYLSSNKNRIFAPSKYTTCEAAKQFAKTYTDNIKVKER